MNLRQAALASTVLATSCVAWGLVERHRFTLRHQVVPVLPAGADPVKVLHITDLHFAPRQYDKVAWLRDLMRLRPDLVVNTGDNLGHRDGVELVTLGLAPFAGTPGVFVMGSNDYYAPLLPRPWRYLMEQGSSEPRVPRSNEVLPTGDLVAGLIKLGWDDLDNARSQRSLHGINWDFVGVDDPHIGYDDYSCVGEPAREGDVVTVGVAHAPYLRVVDAMTSDGVDVVFAGHTHGGQLCLPGGRAIVTNCDLPRRYAKGLHHWETQSPHGGRESSFLHVSAGLGTAPTVPLRFMCPPEATLLHFVPKTAAAR